MKLNIFRRKDNKVVYKCSCCGKEYEEVPLCFGTDFPDHYFSVPPEERKTRIELQESLCVVDEQHFFHRCRLTIPITDYKEDLIWNVWTTISKDNFIKRNDLWANPNRIKEPPYFGWLQTIIPTYGNTLSIKTKAHEEPVGFIPELKILDEDHPLYADQKNGISLQKAFSIVDEIMQEEHKNERNTAGNNGEHP